MQVQAEALAATAQELQSKLVEAGSAMQERKEKLSVLQARLAEEASTMEASGAQVRPAAPPSALSAVRLDSEERMMCLQDCHEQGTL